MTKEGFSGPPAGPKDPLREIVSSPCPYCDRYELRLVPQFVVTSFSRREVLTRCVCRALVAVDQRGGSTKCSPPRSATRQGISTSLDSLGRRKAEVVKKRALPRKAQPRRQKKVYTVCSTTYRSKATVRRRTGKRGKIHRLWARIMDPGEGLRLAAALVEGMRWRPPTFVQH